MRGGGEDVEGLPKCWKVAHVLRGQIGCHCSQSHRTVHGMLRKMRVFKGVVITLHIPPSRSFFRQLMLSIRRSHAIFQGSAGLTPKRERG